MNGDDVREVFEEIFPQDVIERWAEELGVVVRERKRDLMELIRSLVIAAGTPNGGLQADALRSYLESGADPVVRAAFYSWFDDPMERLMERLSQRAMAYAREQEVDLPGVLAGVIDWRIVDASTVKVSDELIEQFPGAGDYAAIKVHKTLSVGTGCAVSYHFSPARDHDSPHLVIDESWAGYGLLADLGYASFERLRACEKYNVRFVIRLKENWKPRVESISRGKVTKTFVAGTDLDLLLEQETLLLDGKAIDAEVTLDPEGQPLRLRLVGVPTPKGYYCFFLTNLPKRIGPLQVGDIYRVRWEVELSFKLDKSVNRLDESTAARPCSIKTMLHASLIASILSTLLVHKHTIATRPKKPGDARTQPPLHPIVLARGLDKASLSIARAFELDGQEAKHEWQRIADYLVRVGSDQNWRRSPSVLDQIRGWKKHTTPKKTPKSAAHAAQTA